MPEAADEGDKTVPMTFRVEAKTREVMDRCVELTGSTKTEVFRQAMRLYLRKLEREHA